MKSSNGQTNSVASGYIKEVSAKQKLAESREHAYRPLLENLLRALLPDKYSVINDPAKVGHNAPDFLIKLGDIPSGYIEAKDITVDLSDKAVQKQAERYLEAFDSLILTNYREFRFYLHDEEYAKITLDDKTSDADLTRFTDLITQFAAPTPRSIKSAKQLAEIMAHKSRIMRDIVVGLLKEQDQTGDIQGQYQAFKQVLIRDLTIEQFADMYTQTLAYGLFVARYFDESLKSFTRHEAQDLLPPANPLLRKFFGHIAGSSFEPRLAWIIDDLIQAYRAADVGAIMHKEFEQKSKDPVLHFYETYLQEYDPKLRKSRGVYYTPEPVVSFIVRSVDEILKRDFGIKDGLADTSTIPWKFKTQNADKRSKSGLKEVTQDVHRVQILDPAAGTGTFLVEVIKEIRKRFKNQEGQWPSYVKEHLLPRLHGFELMMASYTMAHLKLGITLGETGYKETDKRLGVYLTNSLEQGVTEVPNLFMSQWLTEESAEASKVKSELPIMVVIGNPPYSGVSSNETKYANSLIEKYMIEPGGKEKLKERKHWLHDDYVKFIAYAEDTIVKNGEGVMAMITNHGYIDNPTFRGMRWHLVNNFDVIHILDLHGNAKKQEVAPDGSKDENIFNIQQGVAIIFAVKLRRQPKQIAKVFHADLYGKRERKFESLASQPKWKEIKLDETNYFFVQKNMAGIKEYEKGIPLSKLFALFSTGIVTMGDEFITSSSKNEIAQRVKSLADGSLTVDDLNREYGLGKNYAKWVYSHHKNIKFDEEKIEKIAYRPFEYRYTYYDDDLIWRARRKVMDELKKENIGLMVCRQQKIPGFHHVFVHEGLAESSLVSNRTSEIGTTFPLYIHGDTVKENFLPPGRAILVKNLKQSPSGMEILDYVYAALSSPTYREKYQELLRIDFPRVPIPENDRSFFSLAQFGKELRELHLMRSPKVNEFVTTYPVAGSNLVEKPTYKDGKVWINKEQYFGDVPQVAWEFYIGGYQPAQKWLKDRKGRELSSDDIAHYQRIIKVLVETDRVMREIDKVSL